MEKRNSAQVLDGLLERLAAVEHQRWAHWQEYMHSKGARQADGTLVLPADLVERWDQQIATAYAELSDDEKESDREQVRAYLDIIKHALEGP